MKNLVKNNRSYRLFDETHKVTKERLIEFIDLARITPASKNIQPLKYIVVNDECDNQKVFDTLMWAGYLDDFNGPSIGQRPTGYIIILQDKDIYDGNVLVDLGIVSQTILLAATEVGLGGCQFMSFSRNEITSIFELPEKLSPMLVIALGKPTDNVVLVDLDEDHKYYRTEDAHFVPKRKLKDVIYNK